MVKLPPGHRDGTGELELDVDTVLEDSMDVVRTDAEDVLDVVEPSVVSVKIGEALVDASEDELELVRDVSAEELVENPELDCTLFVLVVVL